MKKKMSICIFGYFQWLEQIINIDGKKNFGAVTWDGLLPNCIARRDCYVAIQSVYCKLGRLV